MNSPLLAGESVRGGWGPDPNCCLFFGACLPGPIHRRQFVRAYSSAPVFQRLSFSANGADYATAGDRRRRDQRHATNPNAAKAIEDGSGTTANSLL